MSFLNLSLRFLLELAGLVALGMWGWQYGNNSWLSNALGAGIPVFAAAIWGVFNVLNDPSRSGKAPIQVPGIIRLTIELAFFALPTWALHDLGYYSYSWLLGGLTVLHYIISYNRLLWLIKQ